MRIKKRYKLHNIKVFRKQLLYWGAQFPHQILLEGNNHKSNSGWDLALAVDAASVFEMEETAAWEGLRTYLKKEKDWLFGFFTYDLKNDIEQLETRHSDTLGFPAISFFRPKRLMWVEQNHIYFSYLPEVATEIERDFQSIKTFPCHQKKQRRTIRMQARWDKATYLQGVETLLSHIQRGDIYEANYCQEYFANAKLEDTVHLFERLNSISAAPFAAYMKWQSKFAICSSPERYLEKRGELLRSQPIKGTAKRFDDPQADYRSKLALETDQKERAENIMIVDLVRNDLSRVAKKASVEVTQLCAVETYKQVHQMLSTITAKMQSDRFDIVDVLKATFPMGSMTGAPKIAAMELIDRLEAHKRGLYSGAIGYFLPNGDFDFNVVIRTILYNEEAPYISYSVGSAITAKSIPDAEYEECRIKAEAMRSVLEDL
ncbi:MAG: anthranilate synthase component I family protein [Flavobacteriaceae bacterium]|nr:anthranilate synthase component I family protein [Flavobacteriaceae bacterium]